MVPFLKGISHKVYVATVFNGYKTFDTFFSESVPNSPSA